MTEPFVYIAGKYNDSTLFKIEQNIAKARELAIECAQHQIKHFCPHTHSCRMDYYAPNATWEFWLQTDELVISKLSNCMLMVDNWKDSTGAKRERELALKLGQPIFYEFQKLLEYTKEI